jgi:hypothetical protein
MLALGRGLSLCLGKIKVGRTGQRGPAQEVSHDRHSGQFASAPAQINT